MNLENITLNERIQPEKATLYLMPRLEKCIETESRLVVAQRQDNRYTFLFEVLKML